MKLARPIFAALVFLLGATAAHGQQATLTIRGSVRDAQGESIRGATVRVHGGAERSTVYAPAGTGPSR